MPVRAVRALSFVMAAFVVAQPWTARAQRLTPDDPDQLYEHREVFADAAQAADIWAQRADRSYEAAWKLSRACYWLGTHGPAAQRRTSLQRGVTAGQQATRLEDGGVEGHFWYAANMAGLAESFGLIEGLKYRGRIKHELERAIAIQPGWENGSAEAALGRWYFEVPRLFGGNMKKSEEYLRRALQYGPDNTFAMLYLSEVLSATGRAGEARGMLQRILAAPTDPEWAPEEREMKQQAAERLKH